MSLDVVRYPFLGAWRLELHRGYAGQAADRPSTWRLDSLYHAACWEASAIEAERDGLLVESDRRRERARAIVAEARAEKAAAA